MINVYCDESCHLENDESDVMTFGGIIIPNSKRKKIYDDIYNIKHDFNIPKFREIKWTKVSMGEIDYYKRLIRYFFENDLLTFRGVIVPDKKILRHEDFNQTHDDFYYKMYYVMLKKLINRNYSLNIFLDIKDTNGAKKIRGLQRYLSYKIQSLNGEAIKQIQLIRSHENQILQLTDLLIGALSYNHRRLYSSEAKLEIVNYIKQFTNIENTSPYSYDKFNILHWDAK